MGFSIDIYLQLHVLPFVLDVYSLIMNELNKWKLEAAAVVVKRLLSNVQIKEGGSPWKFLEEGGSDWTSPPTPPQKNSKFTNSYTRRKVTKNLKDFINLKTSWLAFINQGPLVNQNHTIHSSWSLGSLSSTGTLISISLDWHQLLYGCCQVFKWCEN